MHLSIHPAKDVADHCIGAEVRRLKLRRITGTNIELTEAVKETGANRLTALDAIDFATRWRWDDLSAEIPCDGVTRDRGRGRGRLDWGGQARE